MKSTAPSEIATSAQKLFEWLRSRDFKGHDPHDLLESEAIPGILKRSSFLRLAMLQAGRRSPIDLHTLLKVPRRFNAKGGGLILQGLLRGQEQISQNWEAEAHQLSKRVRESAVKTPHGIGWGYPFAWQSRTHYLPANTPTIVATSFVGNALIDYYSLYPDEQLLAELTFAADYILKDVSRRETKDRLAFGYAQNDPQIVFNASLLGAEFLGRLGEALGEQPYIEAARSAANFVIKHQEADGSWFYGLEPSQRWMDSFHTGYVLMSLRSLSKSLMTSAFDERIKRGYDFYRKNFFVNDLPTYHPRKLYPIDTHAAAHAIITLNEFGDCDAALKIARWMTENMQDERGYFYYLKHERSINKLPYIRWSNAWMMLALATLIEETE